MHNLLQQAKCSDLYKNLPKAYSYIYSLQFQNLTNGPTKVFEYMAQEEVSIL